MSTQATPATASAATLAPDERLPFGVLLARLGQESMARFRKALRPLDLSAQQFVVLKQVAGDRRRVAGHARRRPRTATTATSPPSPRSSATPG